MPPLGAETVFSHLLVPLDGSRLAEAILSLTRALARRLGASVTLLHLIETKPPAQIHGQPHLAGAREAEAYLDGLAQELQSEGLQVDWHVHEVPEASVAQNITRHAMELGADLVMLCTHGSGGVRDLVFGSIAQQVIGCGPTPVLIVHPDITPGAFMCRRMVVPLDGATCHESSIPIARRLATVYGAAIHLVSVVPRRVDLGGAGAAIGRFLPTATTAFLDEQERELTSYGSNLVETLQAEGITAQLRVERGDPTTLILQALQATGADLLVLATHARRGWTAFWSGSVAPRVLSQWRRPTLLVRADSESTL